jgi:hypothetical protein
MTAFSAATHRHPLSLAALPLLNWAGLSCCLGMSAALCCKQDQELAVLKAKLLFAGELEQELQGYNTELNAHLENISDAMDAMKEMSLVCQQLKVPVALGCPAP